MGEYTLYVIYYQWLNKQPILKGIGQHTTIWRGQPDIFTGLCRPPWPGEGPAVCLDPDISAVDVRAGHVQIDLIQSLQ